MKTLAPLISSQRGASLLEMLVGLVVSTVVVAGVFLTFRGATGRMTDSNTMLRADERAGEILEMIMADVRLAGSGMPLGQKNFRAGQVGLGDAPLALLTSSSGSSITIRLNDKGRDTVLLNPFDPNVEPRELLVESATHFKKGALVYLTNATIGGDEGFQGRIASVASSSIMLENEHYGSPNTVFEQGTLVSQVSEVTYEWNATTKEVYRLSDGNEYSLGEGVFLHLQYFDSLGNELPLPLSEATIRDELAAVRIGIEVEGSRPLKNRQIYMAEASQLVSLRNFVYSRNPKKQGGGAVDQ